MGFEVSKSDEEWRRLLTPEQYRITREKGTERPFSGRYWSTSKPGLYRCVACGNALFWSDTKFDAGCGWPSFWEPAADSALVRQPDHSHGMVRTEVLCGRCGAHLGHVFDDGPPPTGLRFCINSGAIILDEKATR
ncbi:peptide-methionine (R)-S-oxide reductase MsrB [bacterium]|nr:peptide-methionine (R)-S-oxide reductase MsrB [bacterium]